MIRKRIYSSQGFTLLEVLITMVILSIVLLGFAAMTLGTIRGLAYSDHLTTATNLARKQMEEIKQAAYGGVISKNYPEDYVRIVDYEMFDWKATIEPGPDNTKTVTVDVRWYNDAGATRTVSLSTLIVQW